MGAILKKLESVSDNNLPILKEYAEFLRSKDPKSDRNIINQLTLLIKLDKFFCIPFTSVNTKEQILMFLKHRQQRDGTWVEREHDAEGRYITSCNFYLGVLKIFFRWLVHRKGDDDEEWETPSFIRRIKSKKPLRDSPYGITDIWELNEVRTIVAYEPELRNQAIITLLWDLDARPHEIIALRMKDIILKEQYGEGVIPSNTKTGGGPILLTSSFTYVRDWINKHPLKNEPNARLICNLMNGASLTTQTIWHVMNQLRLRIKRLVETGSVTDESQRQKLEFFLKTKKWNPYCFRHSAITDDSDNLPDFALKKKARWTMNSKQGNRYIKPKMGVEIKNKILERHGIKIANKQQQMVSRTCGRCGYVNKLENKYCERTGCAYPLTQEAFDEIKAAEQAKMQVLVNQSNLERDNMIQLLQQEMKELDSNMRFYRKEFMLYREQYRGRHLTTEERKKTEEFLEQLKNVPDSDD